MKTNYADHDQNHGLPQLSFPFRLRWVRFSNRLLDWVLRIPPDEVLNPGTPAHEVGSPAQRLKQAADRMRTEAIDPDGKGVNYAALSQSEAYRDFRNLTLSLPNFQLDKLSTENTRKAFWINLYNALLLDAIVQYGIQRSLSSSLSLFRRAAYNVGGMRFSADDIENGILRGNRRNPFLPLPPFGKEDPRLAHAIQSPDARIHFALVCGARSCPPIAFYEDDQLDSQLDWAAANFINGGGVEFEPSSSTLRLSKIFQWYQADFGGIPGVIETVARYSQVPEINQALLKGDFKVRFLPYDWTVNRASAERTPLP